VEFTRRLPRRGPAEQREFLLRATDAPFVLFPDDDAWLETGTISRLWTAMSELRCGFVGCAMQGMSFVEDCHPDRVRLVVLAQRRHQRRRKPHLARPGRKTGRRLPNVHQVGLGQHLAEPDKVDSHTDVAQCGS
jgi:hypothetical protein